MVEEGLASLEGFEPPTRCLEGRPLCALRHRITHPERNPSSYHLKLAAMPPVMRKLSLDQQLASQPARLSSSAPTASRAPPPPRRAAGWA